MKFKKWAEARDWFDFQSSRGITPTGYVGSHKSSQMPSVSDDESMSGAINWDFDLDDVKMLHDRMIDSVEIKPTDLGLFLNAIISNMPGKRSGNLKAIRMELTTATKPSYFFILSLLSEAIKEVIMVSRENTPTGHFMKEVLPLLRNIIANFKSHNKDYQREAERYNREGKAIASWSRSQRN